MEINQKYLSILTDRLFSNYMWDEYPEFCKAIQVWLRHAESMYIDSNNEYKVGFWKLLSQLPNFIDIDKIPDFALTFMIQTFAESFSDHLGNIKFFLLLPQEVDLTEGEPLDATNGSKYINITTGKFYYDKIDPKTKDFVFNDNNEKVQEKLDVKANHLYEKVDFIWKDRGEVSDFDPNFVEKMRQYDDKNKIMLNESNIRSFLKWSRSFYKSKGSVSSFYMLFRMFGGNVEIIDNSDDIIRVSDWKNIGVHHENYGLLDIRWKESMTPEQIENMEDLYELELKGHIEIPENNEPNFKYSLNVGINPFELAKKLEYQNFVDKIRPYWSEDASYTHQLTVISGINPHTKRYNHIHGICQENIVDKDWWYTFFSYTLRTHLREELYKDIVLQILHPSGFHMTWEEVPIEYFKIPVPEDALEVVDTYPSTGQVFSNPEDI